MHAVMDVIYFLHSLIVVSNGIRHVHLVPCRKQLLVGNSSVPGFLMLVSHCGGSVEDLGISLHVGAADTVPGCMCFVSWSSSVVRWRTNPDIIWYSICRTTSTEARPC